jgi:hypothetical protein
VTRPPSRGLVSGRRAATAVLAELGVRPTRL